MIVSVERASSWLRAAVLLHLKRYMTVGNRRRRGRLLSCSFMNQFHCILLLLRGAFSIFYNAHPQAPSAVLMVIF